MMQSVVSTLVGVIVPISVPVLCGVLLARLKKLDTKPLLTIVLYILSPAIIFKTLLHARITLADLSGVLLFTAANIMLLWLSAKLAARLLRLSEPETAGLTLVSTLTNCVNYGLPLVLLAFGQAGLEKASVYIVLMMILTHTLGIYLAARSRFSGRNALKSVFTLPAAYAAVAALFLRGTGFLLPTGVAAGLEMLSAAYAPMVLLVLGAQMVGVKAVGPGIERMRAFLAGMIIRMVLSPLIALGILTLLGIDGLLRSVLFILASMPVAVNAVILADRFDAAPGTVSKTILWSTLLSFALLPFLIVWVSG